MKAQYKTRNGRLTLEIEGDSEKALFKGVAKLQEIFDSDQRCGCCRKSNLHFRVRTVEDHDFFEVACGDCGARLSFGQHKDGKGLFPKRKDEDGKPLPNRGWTVWAGKAKQAAGQAQADAFDLEPVEASSTSRAAPPIVPPASSGLSKQKRPR